MTTLYVHEQAPSWSPGATYQGGWEDTAVAITRACGPTKPDSRRPYTIVSLGRAETSLSNVWDVCLVRLVSAPLAANVTIDGTLEFLSIFSESALAADMLLRVHAWVTTGDSTTVRGTLLNGYLGPEPTASPLGVTTGARAVTSVAAQTGDRIVIEAGYRATNAVATSYTGTFQIGGDEDKADVTSGGAVGVNTPIAIISNTLAFQSTVRVTQFSVETAIQQVVAPSTRLSQMLAEVAVVPIPSTRLSQMVVEVLVIPPPSGAMINACDSKLWLTDENGVYQDISGSSNYVETNANTELGMARTFGSRFPIRAQGIREATVIVRALYTTAADEAVDLLKQWFFTYAGYRGLRIKLPDDVAGHPHDQYDFTVRLARLAGELSAEEAGPVMIEAEMRSSSEFTLTSTVA